MSDIKPEHLKAFRRVCQEVINAAGLSKQGALIHYAASYAKRGLDMWTAEEVRAQCPYILSNLGGWRGERAADAKAVLKYLAKNV